MTSRSRAGVLVLLLVAAAAAPVATNVALAQAQPAIANVTVSPENPGVDELVRFSVTVRNAEGASEPFEVTDVYLRPVESSRDLARAEDLGTIPPGETIGAPLTTRFDSAGVRDLRLTVVGRTENTGTTRLRYPVTVVVADRGPQLDVDVDDPVVGARTDLNVTVSNGRSEAIDQVDVRVRGDDMRVENRRRIAARLEGGTDRAFGFAATFEESGQREVEAVLRYQTSAGQNRTVRQVETVTVEELREDVGLGARIGDRQTSRPPIVVEVANLGNAPLEEATLRATDGDRTVARRAVDAVPARTTREVAMNVSGVESADLEVTLDYETGGLAGQASTSLQYGAQPGRIALTGVDVERGAGVTTITGSASNVGLTEVNSVVVAVQPAEGVTPAAPNREFFVGTVPASDFVSFDLTARIDGGVSAVPVQVTYISEGAERSETVTVPIDGGEPVETPGGGGGGGGVLLPALIALVVLAAVGAIVYVGWRNRGEG